MFREHFTYYNGKAIRHEVKEHKKNTACQSRPSKTQYFQGFFSGLERYPTGRSPVMLHTHEGTGSSPVVSTTKKESFVYPTKDSFFELSVPCGTISTPPVREAMLRIVKCLRA